MKDIRDARAFGISHRAYSYRIVRALARDVFSADHEDRREGLSELRSFLGRNWEVSGHGTWALIEPSVGKKRWCADPWRKGYVPIPPEKRYIIVKRMGMRQKRAFDAGELTDLVMEALGWDELRWTDDMFASEEDDDGKEDSE